MRSRRDSMVAGCKQNLTARLGLGENEDRTWQLLRSVAQKYGTKSRIISMERSPQSFARGWKLISNYARTARRYWKVRKTSWGWWATDACFRCLKGSASDSTKRFLLGKDLAPEADLLLAREDPLHLSCRYT